MAFPEVANENDGYFWFSMGLDMLFFIDILMNFNCAIQDENYQIID